IGGSPAKIQEGVIDPGAGIATYVPSVQVTGGGAIGMTYMQASSNQFISTYMTGRAGSAPAGAMDSAFLIFAGKADYKSTRQGDYAGIQLDPGDGSIWAANEYIDSAGDWTTGVGHIEVTRPPVLTS